MENANAQEFEEFVEEGSFEDSERFDEESVCSWYSEPESLCNNWRGWRKTGGALNGQTNAGRYSAQQQQQIQQQQAASTSSGGIQYVAKDGSVMSLSEICAQVVAQQIPFETVEGRQPVPENLQLRIAFWSFPDSEDDIRLYACLANGSGDEFQRGEVTYRNRLVRDVIQIGFHLSGTVFTVSSSSNANESQQNAAVQRSEYHNPGANRIPPQFAAHTLRLNGANGAGDGGQHGQNAAAGGNAPNAAHAGAGAGTGAHGGGAGGPEGGPLQAGSAAGATSGRGALTINRRDDVAVTFDRKRITSCSCTCQPHANSWCSHVVALCLFRIHQPSAVTLRAPVSESLSQLARDQLQKFAQYLISELPQQVLPTAQRLLDQLLSSQKNPINMVRGAPDPTAGGSAADDTAWWLDAAKLAENIRKALVKFCVPSPVVYCDVNLLSSSAPPAAAEWQSILRPLRGREPEGMWNLVAIVREMCKRRDLNAIAILRAVSEEIIAQEQIVCWWFQTKLFMQIPHTVLQQALLASVQAQHGRFSHFHASASSSNHFQQSSLAALLANGFGGFNFAALNLNVSGNGACASQFAAANLCDELVNLWRLAALNPLYAGRDRMALRLHLRGYQLRLVEKLRKTRAFTSILQANANAQNPNGAAAQRASAPSQPSQGSTSTSTSFSNLTPPERTLLQVFVGFKPALDASTLSWTATQRNQLGIPAHKRFSAGSLQSRLAGIACCPSTSQNATHRSPLSAVAAAASMGPDEPFETQFPTDTSSSSAPNCSWKGNREREDTSDNESDSCDDTPPDAADEALWPLSAGTVDAHEAQFARVEALYVHGFFREACRLAKQIAADILANPPVFRPATTAPPRPLGPGTPSSSSSSTPANSTGGWSAAAVFLNPANDPSQFASGVLTKIAFLCQVLSEGDASCIQLAFKLGLYGLELPRQPASNKVMEVKLTNQETELVVLLKRIPLGHAELELVREKALQLRDGRITTRVDVQPVLLAAFIFDALCLPPAPPPAAFQQNSLLSHSAAPPLRNANDETIGFEAALSTLGLKMTVAEADYPLLCEGTRRQRGDLAITMLLTYKDDPSRLVRILDTMLDRDIHKQFRAPPLTALLASATRSTPQSQTQSQNRNAHANANGELANALGGLNLAAAPHANANAANNADDTPPANNANANANGNENAHAAAAPSRAYATVSEPPRIGLSMSMMNSCSSYAWKGVRSKGRARCVPTVPNQPSEALAHFMFELAKSVLAKAGGTSATSLFQIPAAGQHNNAGGANGGGAAAAGANQANNHAHAPPINQPRAPHRALHLCAFQIGLYALGIQNCVASNWLSRNYSSHVSWITGQAMDIGSSALQVLIDTWTHHLTPTEAAALADKASRVRDPAMVRAAAELALSCLQHACSLGQAEIQRALQQCKEQSQDMLERACLAVEQTAKDGSVYPEVLFEISHRWFELYEDAFRTQHALLASNSSLTQSGNSGASQPPSSMQQQSAAAQNLNTNLTGTAGWAYHQQAQASAQYQNAHGVPHSATPPPAVDHPAQHAGGYGGLPARPSSAQSSVHPSNNVSRCNMPNTLSGTTEQLVLRPSGVNAAISAQPAAMIVQCPVYATQPSNTAMYVPVQLGGNTVQLGGNTVQLAGNVQMPTGPRATTIQVQWAPAQQNAATRRGPLPTNLQHSASQTSLVIDANGRYVLAPTTSFNNLVGAAPQQTTNVAQSWKPAQSATQVIFAVQQPVGVNAQMVQNASAGFSNSTQSIVYGVNGTQQAVVQLPSQVAAQQQRTALSVAPPQAQAQANYTNMPPGYVTQAGPNNVMVANMHSQSGPVPMNNPAQHANAQPSMMNVNMTNMHPHGLPAGYQQPPQPVPVNMQQPHTANCPPQFAQGAAPAPNSAQQHAQMRAPAANSSIQQIQPILQHHYLVAAFRVGLLALDMLARHVNDDRPQMKFARSPPHAYDVKWLLQVAMKLGIDAVHQYSAKVVDAVVSPFVLYDLAVAIALYLAVQYANPVNVGMQQQLAAQQPPGCPSMPYPNALHPLIFNYAMQQKVLVPPGAPRSSAQPNAGGYPPSSNTSSSSAASDIFTLTLSLNLPPSAGSSQPTTSVYVLDLHALTQQSLVGPAIQQLQAQLRTNGVNALLQKCLQMFVQSIYQRMHHMNANEYDELVQIVIHASYAYSLIPNGPTQFQELLHGVKRMKACKKELWNKITEGLSRNGYQASTGFH